MYILYFLVGKPSLMLLQKTPTTNLFQKRTGLEDLTGVKDREWAQNMNMMIEKKKNYTKIGNALPHTSLNQIKKIIMCSVR